MTSHPMVPRDKDWTGAERGHAARSGADHGAAVRSTGGVVVIFAVSGVKAVKAVTPLSRWSGECRGRVSRPIQGTELDPMKVGRRPEWCSATYPDTDIGRGFEYA